jgi:oligopeptide transport system substrate-binding protein
MRAYARGRLRLRLATGFIALLLTALLGGCGGSWNDPYPVADRDKNVLYTSFTERPKHLDAAQSYSEDEAAIHAQIYEPPLQYDYLKRPYTLVPMTVEAVPEPRYVNAGGQPVAADAPNVAFSIYDIRIKPGIRYQPHPAFARDPSGALRYGNLTPADLANVYTLADFKETGTQELTAADYVYEIKRLAHPRLNCPIFGLMSEHIVGLAALAKELRTADAALAAKGAAGSTCQSFPWRASSKSTATHFASRSRAGIRNSSTGWRWASSRPCRSRSIASMRRRGWRRRT